LLSNGDLYGFGLDSDGQVGLGNPMASVDNPQKLSFPNTASIKAIAAGGYHSLAVASNGDLYAWGWNSFGQLGDASLAMGSASPQLIALPNGARAAAVAAGSLHSLVLTTGGEVYGFGLNSDGQLGLGSEDESFASPQKLSFAGNASIKAIAAGGSHSLAIASSGDLYVWGWNGLGQLGDPTVLDKATSPKLLALTAPALAVAAGDGHSLVLTRSGAVVMGANASGQLGLGNNDPSPSPQPPVLGAGVVVSQMAGGEGHSLCQRPIGQCQQCPQP
jgi:alpha-tubulin suppressor-like RCC1 family protein